MFSKSISVIVRVVQLLFGIVVLALSANIIATSYWNETDIENRPGNPGAVNYPVFLGISAILCSLYCLPEAYYDWRGQYEDARYVTLGLDALNAIFWFAGAVALSSLMGVHSCSNTTYTRTNVITRDAVNTKRRCQEAQATTAFLWFGFLTFALTSVAAWLYLVRPGLVLHKTHENTAGSQGAPPMAVPTPDIERGNAPPQHPHDPGQGPRTAGRHAPGGHTGGNNGGTWIGD